MDGQGSNDVLPRWRLFLGPVPRTCLIDRLAGGSRIATIQGHKGLIALAEATIAEQAPKVGKAAERVDAARDRLERIKRGESVAGGLGKKFGYAEVLAALKAAGCTPGDIRRMEVMGKLTDEEIARLPSVAKWTEVQNRANERAARQILRARPPAANRYE